MAKRDYITKDSGKRKTFGSGMQRDTAEGKPRFDLVIPLGQRYEESLLYRWAMLLDRGAVKYDERNWEKASGREEAERFKASAFRHFMAWFHHEQDEDHAAAVLFNINGFEFLRDKMKRESRKRK